MQITEEASGEFAPESTKLSAPEAFGAWHAIPTARVVLAELQSDPAVSESDRRALKSATVELTDIIESDRRKKIAEE